MGEVRTEDEAQSLHSAQLRFARRRVLIGGVDSLLKIKAFRDFQILQRSNTTLVKRGYSFCANKCNSSLSEVPC